MWGCGIKGGSQGDAAYRLNCFVVKVKAGRAKQQWTSFPWQGCAVLSPRQPKRHPATKAWDRLSRQAPPASCPPTRRPPYPLLCSYRRSRPPPPLRPLLGRPQVRLALQLRQRLPRLLQPLLGALQAPGGPRVLPLERRGHRLRGGRGGWAGRHLCGCARERGARPGARGQQGLQQASAVHSTQSYASLTWQG